MPNIPQPQRQDEPVVTDADLAALLAGMTDPAPGLRPVADILAALTAEATGMELAGEDRALAQFRRRAAVPVPATHARPSTAGPTSRLGVKIGASAAAVAILFGGGAAAAFADVLPAPIQRLAHEAIGAPIPPPQHHVPYRGRPVPHGWVTHGQSTPHGKPAAHKGAGVKRQARPHATPIPTPQGSPQGQGPHGNNGKGQQGQGSGHGNGNGNGNGNGSGNGNGNGSGQGQGRGVSHGQGSGQAQGNGQGSNGHSSSRANGHGHAQRQRGGLQGFGWPWKPHDRGQHSSPQANWRLAGHPRRFFWIRSIMDL